MSLWWNRRESTQHAVYSISAPVGLIVIVLSMLIALIVSMFN